MASFKKGTRHASKSVVTTFQVGRSERCAEGAAGQDGWILGSKLWKGAGDFNFRAEFSIFQIFPLFYCFGEEFSASVGMRRAVSSLCRVVGVADGLKLRSLSHRSTRSPRKLEASPLARSRKRRCCGGLLQKCGQLEADLPEATAMIEQQSDGEIIDPLRTGRIDGTVPSMAPACTALTGLRISF